MQLLIDYGIINFVGALCEFILHNKYLLKLRIFI